MTDARKACRGYHCPVRGLCRRYASFTESTEAAPSMTRCIEQKLFERIDD